MPELSDIASTGCFSEQDPNTPLWRRSCVEALGTLLLTLAVAACALVAPRGTADPLLGHAVGALAAAAALISLIISLGPVSGGHFNPLITLLQWLAEGRSARCARWYCASQFAGATVGAALANLTYSNTGPHLRASGALPWNLLPSEILCSAALMIVVFACARSGNRMTGAFAVGAWLTAAILATPSRSIANPALAVALLMVSSLGTGSFAGTALIAVAEGSGALIALAIISQIYPDQVCDFPQRISRLL